MTQEQFDKLNEMAKPRSEEAIKKAEERKKARERRRTMTQAALEQQREEGWRKLALFYENEIKHMCDVLYRLYSEGKISIIDFFEVIIGKENIEQIRDMSEEKYNELLTGWKKDGTPYNL